MRGSSLSTLLTALVVMGAPAVATADIVYDWQGPCGQGCGGVATAVITLTDAYVPGTVVGQFDADLFISLEYSSTSTTFTIDRANLATTEFLFTIDPTLQTDSQVANISGTVSWFIDADRVGGGQDWLALYDGNVDFGNLSAGTFTLRNAAVAFEYRYEGNVFDQFSCAGTVICGTSDPDFTSYDSNHRVRASIVVDQPLGSNLALQDITGLPGFNLAISDGLQTLSFPNEIFVSTDDSGHIIGPWSVISNGPVPPNNGVSTLNWPGGRGVADVAARSAPTGPFPDLPRDQGYSFSAPGTWTRTSISQPPGLELRVDLGAEQLYLIGTDVGRPDGSGVISWEELPFLTSPVQGTGVPIVGLMNTGLPALNLNVSLSNGNLAFFSFENPEETVVLRGLGERTDYSYFQPEAKAALAAADGASMALRSGIGFSPIRVAVENLPTPQGLVLHVDVTNEELYLTGSDSGEPRPWFSNPGTILWEEEGFIAVNTQGITLPIDGFTVTPPFLPGLNLSVSWGSEKISLRKSNIIETSVVLQATGERVDYSWIVPDAKTVLAGADGVTLLVSVGAGFSPVRIVVENSPTTPPTAAAGDDRVVLVGDTVSLDGTGSSDDSTPADALRYDWTLVSRPSGSAAILTGETTATPTFVADAVGVYRIQLVVTDTQDLVSAADEVVITAFDGFSPAHSLANTSAGIGCGDLTTCGYAFEVASEVVLSALGVTYAFATNKNQTADVGLWDDLTGELLASVAFSDAADGDLVDQHRYASIGPIILFPGIRYVIGSIYGGPNPDFASGVVPGELVNVADVNSPIMPIEGREIFNPGVLTRPTFSNGGPDGRLALAANFLFGVESTNAAPTASAGSDQTVRTGVEVVLDGSGSLDDATPVSSLTFDWSFVSRPFGSAAMLQNATSATPSFVADIRGPYTVQVVVTDEQGASSAPDEVVITGNDAPIADAGRDRFVLVGTTVTLDGSNSADFDSDPLTYAWSLLAPQGSDAALDAVSVAMPSFLADVLGTYTAELTVADALGPSAPVSVGVKAMASDPPTRGLLDFESNAAGRPFLVDAFATWSIPADEYADLGVTFTDGDDELTVVRIVPGNEPLSGFHLRTEETGPQPSGSIEVDFVDGSREAAFDFATTNGRLRVTGFDANGGVLFEQDFTGDQAVNLTRPCAGPICQPVFFAGLSGQVVVDAGGPSIHRLLIVAPALDPLPPSVVQTQRLVVDNLRYEPPLPETSRIGRGVTLEPGVVIGENVVVLANAFIGADAQIGDGAIIGRDVRVEARAVIEAGAVIGRAAQIGTDAAVGQNTWVGRAVVIESAATVGRNVVVLRNASIGEGALIGDNSAIGPGARVESGAVIDGEVLLGRDVYIGRNVVVGRSVFIGRRSVICARARIEGSSWLGRNNLVDTNEVIPAGSVLPGTSSRPDPSSCPSP